MNNSEIVVVGSSNTDMIMQVKNIPVPGETVIGGEFSTAAGGKGANQAVAAARAGGAVTSHLHKPCQCPGSFVANGRPSTSNEKPASPRRVHKIRSGGTIGPYRSIGNPFR